MIVIKNKAKIAGLVHDCAKYFTDDQVEDCIKKFNIDLDPLEENNIALSHSVNRFLCGKRSI